MSRQSRSGRRVWPARLLAAMLFLALFAPVVLSEADSPELQPVRDSGTIDPGPAGQLIAQRSEAAPLIDGQIDELWSLAAPLAVDLRARSGDGAARGTMRALYFGGSIYFLFQWPGLLPAGDEDVTTNLVIVHWSIPDDDVSLSRRSCNVACHTGFASTRGRLAYVHADTIPQAVRGRLPSAGGWRDGWWTMEWGRPLRSANPYDVQLVDMAREYAFFVKLFGQAEGQPSLASPDYVLAFAP